MRLPHLAVVARPALADVVQQRGDQQQVGPVDVAGQLGRGGRRLDQVAVDGEPVPRDGAAAASARGPTRGSAGTAAPPGPAARAAARRRGRWPAAGGTTSAPRPARAPAAAGCAPRAPSACTATAAGPPAPRRPRRAAAGRGRRPAARPARAPPRRPGGPRPRRAARGAPGGTGRADGAPAPASTRRQVSSATKASRRPARLTSRSRASSSGRPERVGHRALLLTDQDVGGPAGAPAQLVADVEQERVGGLELGRRLVAELGRGDGAQHLALAQAAVRLLDVGFEQERELAQLAGPLAAQVAQLREQPGRRLPPAGEGRRPEPGGELGVTRDEPGVEQAEPGLDVGRAHRDGLGHRAHRVVEPDAGVPDRVPERVGDRRRSRGGPRGPARGRGHRAAAAPAGRGCRRRRARCRRYPCAVAGCPGAASAVASPRPRRPGARPARRRPRPPARRGSAPAAPARPARVPLSSMRVGRGGGLPHHPGRRVRLSERTLRARRPRARRSGRGRSRRSSSPRPCRRRSARSRRPRRRRPRRGRRRVR